MPAPDVLAYQSALLADLTEYWKHPEPDQISGEIPKRLAGTLWDQEIPAGVANPFWQIIRNMPLASHPRFFRHNLPCIADMVFCPDGVRVFGDRHALSAYYAYSICAPTDIRWISETLQGAPVVEVGCGGGYWAWQMTQAGIDVIAYDPARPGDNHPYSRCKWSTVLRGDATAARDHPDRALFLSWPCPSHQGGAWAADALAAYKGDTLIYAADPEVCADESFYALLADEWEETDMAPAHVSWWMINDRLSMFRRKGNQGHHHRRAYVLAS